MKGLKVPCQLVQKGAEGQLRDPFPDTITPIPKDREEIQCNK